MRTLVSFAMAFGLVEISPASACMPLSLVETDFVIARPTLGSIKPTLAFVNQSFAFMTTTFAVGFTTLAFVTTTVRIASPFLKKAHFPHSSPVFVRTEPLEAAIFQDCPIRRAGLQFPLCRPSRPLLAVLIDGKIPPLNAGFSDLLLVRRHERLALLHRFPSFVEQRGSRFAPAALPLEHL